MTSARDAVEAVTRDYIESWYAGDPDRMARALHDDLVKRTPDGDELRAVSKQRMVGLTRDGGGSDVADPAIEVVVDAVDDDIATARTMCADYVDFLHLARSADGTWQIVDIMFHGRGS